MHNELSPLNGVESPLGPPPEVIRLISDGVLRSTADFTSSKARNLFDSDGLLVIDGAGANEARRTYVDNNGVLIPVSWFDGGVTEISGDSADLTNWNTSNTTAEKDAIGLTGNASEAFTVTDTSDSSIGNIFKDTTVPNDSLTRYGHFRVEFESSPTEFSRLLIQYTGGTGVAQGIVFDASDGSYVETNANGSVVLVKRIGNFWLVSLSLANNSTGNTSFRRLISPTYNDDATAGADGTVTGSKVAASVEAFTTNPSFHPMLTTGGTTQSLDEENASLPIGTWFNATKGSIPATVWIPAFIGTQTICEVRNDDSNRIRLQVNSSGNVFATVDDASGTGGTITSTGTLTAATEQKVELVYGSSGYRIHINGAKDGEDATLTVPSGLTTANIGHANNADHLYGGIADLPYIPREESEAQANARTTL